MEYSRNIIKSIYIIEYKYKNSYKKAVSFSISLCASHITFNGAEVNNDFDLTNYETQEKFKEYFQTLQTKDKTIAWINVVEIETKRITTNR